jgi:uncharacterized protein YlxP (DUF503 family)
MQDSIVIDCCCAYEVSKKQVKTHRTFVKLEIVAKLPAKNPLSVTKLSYTDCHMISFIHIYF